MDIIEITSKEYDEFNKTPFSAFENSPFYDLNKNKVDSIHYLVFNDGKNRFVTCAGIKEGAVKFPFSASFSMLNSVTHRNKILIYHEAIDALNIWSKEKGCVEIVYSLPPLCYDSTSVTLLTNALFTHGYKIADVEVNYEYYLDDFTSNYEMDIDPKARQKLRASLKNDLTFEKTDDVDTVYNVIKRNRSYRGFPLWMSLEDVKNTIRIIHVDMFLAKDNTGVAIASALIYHLSVNIVRIIYWGNTEESEALRPMNYLAYRVFDYYSNTNVKIIDIGHSTENSIPNFGLCDFKQSIGCRCSPKFYMIKQL